MKHYYLINGTVKVSDSKMPETHNLMRLNDEFRKLEDKMYNDWLSSLQPCEIDESELDKIVLESHWNYNSKPKDITDIVFEKDGKIYFKQPTEKQVEGDLHNHKDWDLAYYFYRLGRFEEREGMFQSHFKEYLIIKSE